jgi:hypothetical protein
MRRRAWADPWLERIAAYKAIPGNECGGSLHIYTDDGNSEQWHLESCVKFAKEHDDVEGAALAEELLSLSHRQRHTIYYLHWNRLAP